MDHLWERYWSLFLVAWFMLGSPGEWSRNHHHDNGVLTAFSKWWFLRKNPRKALVGSLALNASVFLTFWVSSLWLVHTEQNLKEKAHFNYSDCTDKYSENNLKKHETSHQAKIFATFCVFFKHFAKVGNSCGFRVGRKKFRPLGVIEKASPPHHIKKEEALLVQMGVRGAEEAIWI